MSRSKEERFSEDQVWVTTESMLEGLGGPVDRTWAADLAGLRTDEDMDDPFAVDGTT